MIAYQKWFLTHLLRRYCSETRWVKQVEHQEWDSCYCGWERIERPFHRSVIVFDCPRPDRTPIVETIPSFGNESWNRATAPPFRIQVAGRWMQLHHWSAIKLSLSTASEWTVAEFIAWENPHYYTHRNRIALPNECPYSLSPYVGWVRPCRRNMIKSEAPDEWCWISSELLSFLRITRHNYADSNEASEVKYHHLFYLRVGEQHRSDIGSLGLKSSSS